MDKIFNDDKPMVILKTLVQNRENSNIPTDFIIYIFGGYINGRELSNKIIKIYPNPKQPMIYFELEEIEIN